MSDTTKRRNGKWARVHGTRGAWTVALGWRGEFKACRVNTCGTKLLADTIAAGWLND